MVRLIISWSYSPPPSKDSNNNSDAQGEVDGRFCTSEDTDSTQSAHERVLFSSSYQRSGRPAAGLLTSLWLVELELRDFNLLLS